MLFSVPEHDVVQPHNECDNRNVVDLIRDSMNRPSGRDKGFLASLSSCPAGTARTSRSFTGYLAGRSGHDYRGASRAGDELGSHGDTELKSKIERTVRWHLDHERSDGGRPPPAEPTRSGLRAIRVVALQSDCPCVS